MTVIEMINQYVVYRQSLGAKYITNTRQLRQFAKFIGNECSPSDIYSNDELERMFDAALHYQQRPSKTYPECMKKILQITYFLGLRLHETLHLRLGDVNIDNSYALIRETKFYKSRYVPFNMPVNKLFSDFMKWRKEMGMPDDKEETLFLTRKNKPMRVESIWLGFSKIRNWQIYTAMMELYINPEYMTFDIRLW